MLQDDEGADEFVSIDLDTKACQVCLRESTEEVTSCQICGDLLSNGAVRFGFNDVRDVVHADIVGHDRCFREEHCRQLKSALGDPGLMKGLQPGANPGNGRLSPNHHHYATHLPKPSHLDVGWVFIRQNGYIRSRSNPGTRSSSPIHLGRRASESNPPGMFTDRQCLELRRNTIRYLFGEDSPEFERYASSPPPSSVSFKEDHFSFIDGRKLVCNSDQDVRGRSVPQVTLSRRFSGQSRGMDHKNGFDLSGSPPNPSWNSNQVAAGKALVKPHREQRRFFGRGNHVNRSVNNNNEEIPPVSPTKRPAVLNYTRKEMGALNLDLLREILESLQHIVTDTSTDLVALLEERDTLKHENDTRHVTIQKLVQMQKTVRRSSPIQPRRW